VRGLVAVEAIEVVFGSIFFLEKCTRICTEFEKDIRVDRDKRFGAPSWLPVISINNCVSNSSRK
jgi:hypothetical protein